MFSGTFWNPKWVSASWLALVLLLLLLPLLFLGSCWCQTLVEVEKAAVREGAMEEERVRLERRKRAVLLAMSFRGRMEG